jgi:hypothetical protein
VIVLEQSITVPESEDLVLVSRPTLPDGSILLLADFDSASNSAYVFRLYDLDEVSNPAGAPGRLRPVFVDSGPASDVVQAAAVTSDGNWSRDGLGYTVLYSLASTRASGTVVLTGLPNDKETVTIPDGVNTVTYEFDTDASVEGTNVLVTAVTDATTTANNLRTAIKAQLEASNSFVGTDTTAGAGTVTLDNWRRGTDGNQTVTQGLATGGSASGNLSVTGLAGATGFWLQGSHTYLAVLYLATQSNGEVRVVYTLHCETTEGWVR